MLLSYKNEINLNLVILDHLQATLLSSMLVFDSWVPFESCLFIPHCILLLSFQIS